MAGRDGSRRQGRGSAEVSRRHTQGRVSGSERDKRGKQGKIQADPRGRTARGEGDAGGQQRHIGAPHCAQNDAMPMIRIEPYRPPCPTIRELMQVRPARADDGGNPPKGYLGRPPKSAYRTEDTAKAERHVRARGYSPGAGRGSGEHTEQESGSKRAGGEGREEREDRRVTRATGARLAWPGTAKGHVPRAREDQRRTPRGAVTR